MLAQVFAVIIFIAMFVFIVTEIVERHIVSLVCALLTMILVFGVGMHSMTAVIETINLKSIFAQEFWYLSGETSESSAGINWETILFIFGMMVMVEGMARVGFFRW
ncbi:MAG: citrate transporter, partial [Lachnospiraceae bacterium]|nr:citrate transporter [Lachnospiraceae bacterium]